LKIAVKNDSRTAKTVAICEPALTPENWRLSSWKRSTVSEISFASSIGLPGLKSHREILREEPSSQLDPPAPDLDAVAQTMRVAALAQRLRTDSELARKAEGDGDLDASDSNQSTEVALEMETSIQDRAHAGI
jgi:hypothetical protein